MMTTDLQSMAELEARILNLEANQHWYAIELHRLSNELQDAKGEMVMLQNLVTNLSLAVFDLKRRIGGGA